MIFTRGRHWQLVASVAQQQAVMRITTATGKADSVRVHPETASCGPYLRSRSFEIRDVAALRLRFQNRWRLYFVLAFAPAHRLKCSDGIQRT